MQRSSSTKLQATSAKRTNWWPSTVALALISVVGALGINQKLTSDSANSFGGGSLTGNTSTPPAPTTPATVTKSATGDPINYPFGTIQVSVKQGNGKLTAINFLKEQASGGRDQAFPYLVQYALKANGSNFGNLSGASYTTQAFKQALDSAVSKL